MSDRPTTQSPVLKQKCGKTTTLPYGRGGNYTYICGKEPGHDPRELCEDIYYPTKFKPTKAAVPWT